MEKMEKIQKIQKTGIGVVGLPGAGKSVISEVAQQLKIPSVVLGDVIRNLCTERGLAINSKNLGELMTSIRKEEGMNAVAKRALPQIMKLDDDVVIIDGLRSYEEVEFFRSRFAKFIIMAVHAAPHIRYERIRRRKRSDDPQNFRAFQERDHREISAGIAKILALADIMLLNEGNINQLKYRLTQVLHLIKEGKWRQPSYKLL
jgi:dephospho-CoA kinase